jgi:amidase
MKTKTKTILKWTGIVLGSLLLIIISLGVYVNSLIPKYEGECPPLQTFLFARPETNLPMEGKYIYKSATELAAMIHNHEATSYDIVQEFIANIKNNNYKYNAIVWLREHEALAEAKKADEAVSRGDSLPILHGIPVTVKEMFWVKGLTNNLNSKMMGGFIAPEDGALVSQLKKSGAIILGTSNVPFMLGDFQTYGEIYPTCNNPYDTTKTPGGSSGGSAAALAAGFTPLELGSDLGGSISVPSAFCGVFGLKTTFGTLNITQGTGPDTITKYSRFGMGVPGPMARTAEDLERMWLALRETSIDQRFQHETKWQQASDKKLNEYRIGWTDDWQSAKVGEDVKAKLQLVINLLMEQGTYTEKKIPALNTEMQNSFFKAYALMFAENQPWIMRKLISMDFSKFDDGSTDVSAFYDAMNHPGDENWKQWEQKNAGLIETWENYFKDFDFVICPVTYGPAFTKCKLGSPIETGEGKVAYSSYLIPYSVVFAATGHPSVTIPVGLNKEGLPIGVQIVGSYYSEPELLHFTKLVEKLLPKFQKPNDL